MEATELIGLKFTVSSTDYTVPLGIKVFIDDKIIYENSHVKKEELVEYHLQDTDASHNLTFELFGKLPAHTKINENGDILQDVLISISKLEIDDIDILQMFQDLSVYRHNFNGTKDFIDDKFNGSMGCNGTVSLNFSTPFYVWLLENM